MYVYVPCPDSHPASHPVPHLPWWGFTCSELHEDGAGSAHPARLSCLFVCLFVCLYVRSFVRCTSGMYAIPDDCVELPGVGCCGASAILFYSFPFHSIPFYSILFYSIPFHSIPFRSILFYSIPFHSIPFCFILFHSIYLSISTKSAGSVFGRAFSAAEGREGCQCIILPNTQSGS